MNKVFNLFNLQFQIEANGTQARLRHMREVNTVDGGRETIVDRRTPRWSFPLIDLWTDEVFLNSFSTYNSFEHRFIGNFISE